MRISSPQFSSLCVDKGSFLEPIWDLGLLEVWTAVGEDRNASSVHVLAWHLGDPYLHHCSKAEFWYCDGDLALASTGRVKICCGPPLTSYRPGRFWMLLHMWCFLIGTKSLEMMKVLTASSWPLVALNPQTIIFLCIC